MKVFYLDFIRQIIEQALLNEHIKNTHLVGGENELALFSFYEQLVEQDEVDRYVEKFKQLADQQNRMGLIANGILSAPENPTITNLNKHLIVPLNYMCAFRITLEDRDLMLDTINNLISIYKGRKVDICEFDNGKLFMVGTLGNNVNGYPLIKIGDFMGTPTTYLPLDTFIKNKLNDLFSKGFIWENTGNRSIYLYYEKPNGTMSVALYNQSNNTWGEITDDGTYDDVIFPPSHNSFTKYKVSLSFDALRCDTPRSLNGDEVITISFSGSATIVDRSVLLGNDLTKLSIEKNKLIEGSTTVDLSGEEHFLEPLEMPSSSNADTQLNRLMSNKFITNTHTDSLALSTKYTFIVDTSDSLIASWYKYARFGIQPTTGNVMSPNIIYAIREYYCEWGNVDIYTYNAKIVESIDIENTESDTLTIGVNFQVQGDNN